jgi:hypothetical protein
MTAATQVHRDSMGAINGPDVRLPEAEDRTFVGEVHETIKDLDLLLEIYDVSNEMEQDLRHLIDAAIGMAFDYGAQYGRSGGPATHAS